MIKPLEEIPMSIKEARRSYRAHVRADIREAITRSIFKFEFVGDDYNFKTLANTAREEAQKEAYKIVCEWSKMHSEYKERNKWWIGGSWEINNLLKLIKISTMKGDKPDTRRVFCEIKPDMDAVIQEYAEKQCQEYEERQAKKNVT